MTYELASQIHESIEAAKNELRFDLYQAAVRYSVLRCEWHLAAPEVRREMEGRRTPPHTMCLLTR